MSTAHVHRVQAHVGAAGLQVGLRRALVSRRANLGDCADAASVARRVLVPGGLREPAAVVPLSRRRGGEASLCDLALSAVREALAAFPGVRVQALVLCHTSPDERTAESAVGRLQFELGLDAALPFAVSQCPSVGTLAALDLAASLIEGPEAMRSVVVVAADKLVFGPPPAAPGRMHWRDSAAAVLLTAEPGPGAWQLRPARLARFATTCHSARAWPQHERAAFVAHCAAMLRTAWSAEAQPRGLQAVPGGGDAAFAAAVHEAAGLALPPPPVLGCASAEPLLQLARAVQDPACANLLLWSHGPNGEAGCLRLARRPA